MIGVIATDPSDVALNEILESLTLHASQYFEVCSRIVQSASWQQIYTGTMRDIILFANCENKYFSLISADVRLCAI